MTVQMSLGRKAKKAAGSPVSGSLGVSDRDYNKLVESLMQRRMTRRQAITGAGKVAIGAGVVAVVGSAAYAAYVASLPAKVVTATQTATQTQTATATATETATTTATTTSK